MDSEKITLSPGTLRMMEESFQAFSDHPQRHRLNIAFEKKRNLQEASRRAQCLLVLAKAAQVQEDRCEQELAQEPALELLHATAAQIRLFSREQAQKQMQQSFQTKQDQSLCVIALEMAIPSSSCKIAEPCCVCLDPLDDVVRIVKSLKCQHCIHADCWSRLIAKEEQAKCPMCRAPMVL
jgi:hypothetical protein